MRKLLSLFIAVFSSIVLVAQKSEKFIVEYSFTQKPRQNSISDSISKLVYSGAFDTSNTVSISSFNLFDRVASLEIKGIIYVEANKDSSKLYYDHSNHEVAINNDQPAGFNLVPQIGFPDTSYYFNKAWHSSSDIIPLQQIEIPVSITEDKKQILGYDCFKVIGKNPLDQSEIIFWVTKDLPSTINPYRGLNNNKFAILEFEQPEKKMRTIATKITRY